MTKEQTATIPEELYNLTQLAEVTLAAGRLSTTNVSEIKDYINSRSKTPDQQHQQQQQQSQVMLLRQTTDVTHVEQCGNKQPTMPLAAASSTTNNITAVAFYSSSDDDSNYYSHKIFDRKKLRRSTISDNSRFDEHSSCSSSNLSIICGSNSSDEQLMEQLGCDGGKMTASDSGGSLSGGLLDDEHICPECGKKYSTSSNLARHRQTHRSIMDKKARRCPYCEKVYVSMPAFSMHVRTHNQGCECQYCGKCFSRPWLLQGHIRTHTGEKPFKCNVCNKAFADKSNLRAHIQTHSNTKPHSCARCGKAFALKSYLYKHEESSCMKNHSKTEKEGRSCRNSTSSTSLSLSSSSSSVSSSASSNSPSSQLIKTNAAQISSNGESAKFTLASKLLQKRANPAKISSTSNTTEQSINLNSAAAARNMEYSSAIVEKSYTSITNTMTQEDYERFKRISVIRTPPTGATLPGAMLYPEISVTAQMPIRFYTASASHSNNNSMNNNSEVNAMQRHLPQDIPVDFSPKNNFTHSTKTSPFELTGNYAIVA